MSDSKYEAFKSRIIAQLISNFNLAGREVVAEIRQSISVPESKGKPSRPGENPKRLTGKLANSIGYKVDEKGFSLTIGSSSPVASFLQLGTKFMKPRPFLSMAYDKEKTIIGKIVVGG